MEGMVASARFIELFPTSNGHNPKMGLWRISGSGQFNHHYYHIIQRPSLTVSCYRGAPHFAHYQKGFGHDDRIQDLGLRVMLLYYMHFHEIHPLYRQERPTVTQNNFITHI